ncbi:N-acetylmuramoyl-L-alanine amidase [Pseudidiomarina sp. WS423]|uniref:N-acetylmuramoyl-L-alanine amidase n=1 Tax=Pseudidiomarina sp. WS423 TaxID=3425124 RepID=UPI003D6F1F24
MPYWIRVFISCSLLLFSTTSFSVQVNSINNVRMWPAPDNTRVVFDLSATPDFSYFTLYQQTPYRLVIDFNQTALKVDLAKVENNSLLIKKIRTSTPKNKQSTRVVIELNDKIEFEIFPVRANEQYGERLVIDLKGRSIERKNTPLRADELQERKVTIAIDAGHGGDDPGSIGPSGAYEKDIVLKISKALADMINQDPAMQAYLIRSGDYYVGLKARARKAQEIEADLLVSIHADAFTSPKPRGGSVWVLSSRRATTEMGRMLEDKERLSDVLGGIDLRVESDDTHGYLNKALIDMTMGHAMSAGFEVAEDVLKHMDGIAIMHKDKPQHASFAVLTSGKPSILVETGFISNPQEEQQLLSNAYQQRMARAIYQGVRDYFTRRPPDGSSFVSSRAAQHVVKSGESLSVIAKRYNTTVKALKTRNNLTSNVLQVGQVLDIP